MYTFRFPLPVFKWIWNFWSGNRRNWKQKPNGVHGQLEGCNRNLRQKADVANNNHLATKLVYYTSLIILSKFGPNWSSSSRENAKKRNVCYRVCHCHGRKKSCGPDTPPIGTPLIKKPIRRVKGLIKYKSSKNIYKWSHLLNYSKYKAENEEKVQKIIFKVTLLPP